MDWFLYDNGRRHERAEFLVKSLLHGIFPLIQKKKQLKTVSKTTCRTKSSRTIYTFVEELSKCYEFLFENFRISLFIWHIGFLITFKLSLFLILLYTATFCEGTM